MKKFLALFILSCLTIFAYSQDNMNKKMDNNDPMNKRVDVPNDSMNKKLENPGDTTHRVVPKSQRDSTPRKKQKV